MSTQNKAIQYTIEKEDQSRKLNFLYVTIINTGVGKYDFKTHRKNAIVNHSYVNPASIRGIFKWFVPESKKLCFEKYLDEELH